jgi:hypothetical protein
MRRLKGSYYAKGLILTFGAGWLFYFLIQLTLGIANTKLIFVSASQTTAQCHGLTLPASATIFSHNLSPSPVVIDGGATTRLQLSKNDFQKFLVQLKIDSTEPVQHGLNSFPPSWAQSYYHCDSPTGDALMITVGDTNLPIVDLQIYTDWN